MNHHAIRLRAEALLKELDLMNVPVRVDLLAGRLGLPVVPMDLDRSISGLLIRSGNNATIGVRKEDAPTRKRFTIAHEIGHHQLGHQFQGDEQVHVDRGYSIRMRSPKSSTGEDKMEVEANQFAASLLMPEQLIRHEVSKIRPDGSLSDTDVADLAKTFQVSEQAMTIRLTVLRLL